LILVFEGLPRVIMRVKILIPVVLMSFLLLGLFVLARKQSSPNDRNSQQETQPIEASSDSIAANKTTRSQQAAASLTAGPVTQQPAVNDENTPAGQHQAYVEKRIDELMELAMTDDRSSLDTILSELTNRDPQIRKGALEAAIQFGSRDAIPNLMDLVSQVDDPKEKADIVEAIEFLKLPSATEVIAQSGRANAAVKKGMRTRPGNSTPTPLKK
jgi:hypothetical protein